MPSKHRAYVFTINNPVESDHTAVAGLGEVSRYYCVAPEVGEGGTSHLQGYVAFINQRALGSVSRLLPRAHLEPANGSAEENRRYIFGPYEKNGKTKPANPEAEECGELPQQGKRKDIEDIKDALRDGKRLREIIDDVKNYQGLQFAEKAIKYYEPPRAEKPYVEWYYGPTGTGKSFTAFDTFKEKEYYVAMETSKWWEGYDGHKFVIIDDMRGDFAKYHVLLRLLDRYEVRVETKGGSRQFVATNIIITSAKSPRDTFLGKTDEDLQQLLRRIDVVKYFAPGPFNPVAQAVSEQSIDIGELLQDVTHIS